MLLETTEFSKTLNEDISLAKTRILIASAFIKINALQRLLSQSEAKDVEVIVRWRKHDLIAGASDLEVYRFCKKKGWKLGVCQNLHGKIYCIDDKNIYLGSANLTQRGLDFCRAPNLEFGTKIKAEAADFSKINSFLSQEVSWLNDEKFQIMEEEINNCSRGQQPFQSIGWSEKVNKFLLTEVRYLWVRDLTFSCPEELMSLNLNNETIIHDFELLNLDIDNLTELTLAKNFKSSRCYMWIRQLLVKNEELSFGSITYSLHNSLLDDPLPYRKNIKEFVAILFSWMEFLRDDFEVTKHNRTKSVRLKEK